MADFNKPAMGDNYVKNYDDIKANTNAVAAMFKGVTNPQNLPQYSVKLDNGVLQRWNGSAWLGEQIQVQSGGTGASTAAGARTNLSVYSIAEIDALESAVQSQIDGNDTDIANLKTSVTTLQSKTVDATTTNKGIVQLNDTLASTSTTQALTAAQGRVLSLTKIGNGEIETVSLAGKGNFTGGFLTCVKVGWLVSIEWSGVTCTSSSSPSATGVIPANFRPAANRSKTIEYFSNRITTAQVNTDGTLGFWFYNASGLISLSTVSNGGETFVWGGVPK